jgi:hypothetical protein
MNSFYTSILATVRAWLGLDHDRLYPSHGWLLRTPALVRVHAVAPPPPRGMRR